MSAAVLVSGALVAHADGASAPAPALLPAGDEPAGPDAGATTCTTTSWGGANGWVGLTTYGEANIAGTAPDDYLEVTPDAQNNFGRVFTTSAAPLVDHSFSTHFTFRFASNFVTDGAGGLAFALASPTNFSLGLVGDGQLGIADLDKYVAVALDDFQNAGDLSNSDIAAYVNDAAVPASAATLDSVEPGADFDDGTTRNAWIDYDSTTQTLEVRVAADNTRPTDPVLSQTVDLDQALGGVDPFVGFTSSTGQNVASHNVLSWQFANCYQPFGVSDGGGGGANTPPTVSAGGNTSGAEGSPISLDGSVTDPDSAQTLHSKWTYAWDPAHSPAASLAATCTFGDDTQPATTITCTDNGVVDVTLTGKDGVDTVDDTAAVTVANRNPQVHLTAPADKDTGTTYDVGSAVPLAATATDPGDNDLSALTCTVDWGDGTSETCTASHTYAAEGVYPLTVTVTDDDGGTGTDSVMVDVEPTDDGGGDTTRATVSGGGFAVVVGKIEFSVHADSDKKGRQHGHIELRTFDKHHFHGGAVTGLTVDGTTASWSGVGTWDGLKGCGYTVQVVDGGDGKLRTDDRIILTIRDPGGTVLYMLNAHLAGGNIKVRARP